MAVASSNRSGAGEGGEGGGFSSSYYTSNSKLKMSKDSYTLISVQKDAVQCLVHLIGTGYTMMPMGYLCSNVDNFDAVMVRHMLHSLLSSLQPPFSTAFVSKMAELLSANSVKKAIASTHFAKEDGQLLKLFVNEVKKECNEKQVAVFSEIASSAQQADA